MIKSRRYFIAGILGTAAILPVGKLPTPANVFDHLKGCWTWYETKEILHALPARKHDIGSRKEDPYTILSDFNCGDLMQLNPMAARIWELCDGGHSVDMMVSTMTADYDVSPGVCIRDVIIALTTFKRKGLISC